MAAVTRKFVAKYGLDNNATPITNLGATGSSLEFAGGHSTTLTTTGTTTLTLPTTGTLLTTTGNAASATSLDGGAAGNVPYQSAASTTAFVTNAAGVLQAASSGAVPTWTTTPTLTGTNFTSIPNSATTATSNNTINTIVLRNGFGDFSARIGTFAGTGTSSGVTLSGTVTNATDATTKSYVDSVLAGLSWKQAVRMSSLTTAGNLTATYSNGTAGVGATLTNSGTQAAFALDGVTAVLNDRVLIRSQTTSFQNGIYIVTTVGTVSSNWVLTRATDCDSPAEFTNATVYVSEGSENADTGWTQTAAVPTVGAGTQTWAQFSGNGSGVASFSTGTTGLLANGLTTAQTGAVTLSGTLDEVNGGTGQSVYAVGDILFASTTTALSRLADVATGNALISGGVGVAPSWGKIGLTTHVSGTLAATSGGTGQSTYAVGDLLVGGATNTLTKLTAVAAGSYLRSAGAGTAPVWSTTILPNSATVGDLLQATTANNYTNLAAVATGNVLLSGGVGTASSWGKVTLTAAGSHVTGILPLANGGTNANLTAAAGGVAYSTASAIALTAVGTAGQILVSNAASAPSWSSTFTTTGLTINTGATLTGYMDGATLTTSTTTPNQIVDATISSTLYRAVNYKISVASGSSYQFTEVYAIHDGTTVYVNEINTMLTGTSLATFDVDISGGNLRLLAATVANAVTVIKAVITAIAI